MHNPFTIGSMIQNPAEFVGRMAELQFLLTRLRSLQSCSVVGERRIGKSSLLYHLHPSVTRREIVRQFLLEAMTLTFLGGILGVLLAIAVSYIIMLFLPTPFRSGLSPGVSVSIMIGLIFGVWPARKASRLTIRLNACDMNEEAAPHDRNFNVTLFSIPPIAAAPL